MTRQRREAREAAAREDAQSKMAPPPQHQRQPDTPAKGGGSAAEAASRLERFARTPHKQQPSASESQVPLYEGTGGTADHESPAPGSHQAQHSPQAAEYEHEVCPDHIHVGEEGATAEPTIKDVFLAISTCNTTLNSLNLHVSSLKADMAFVRQDMQQIKERVKEAEVRISTVEDQLPPIHKELKQATQQIATLLNKVDDLENRSRRNNVRLVGVPERVEGRDPVAFFESWLKETIGSDALSPYFTIERAHRVPPRPPPPGAPPRPVLMKLLHFRDRDTLLRVAREKGDLSINGHRVSLYPDFSGEIQKKRMQFVDIKKRLRNIGVPYSMQYPAKLRIAAMNTTHFFESPKAALVWLDTNERFLRGSDQPG